MALPTTINAATPAASDSPGEGDDQLRALKLAILDFLGIPDNTSLTAAAFAITAAGVVTIASGGLVPFTLSGTPAQHALYRENVPKVWIEITVAAGVPSLGDNFNVTGTITDGGVGTYTFSFDRDFANTTYVGGGSILTADGRYIDISSRNVGSCTVRVLDAAGAVQDNSLGVFLIGDQ